MLDASVAVDHGDFAPITHVPEFARAFEARLGRSAAAPGSGTPGATGSIDVRSGPAAAFSSADLEGTPPSGDGSALLDLEALADVERAVDVEGRTPPTQSGLPAVATDPIGEPHSVASEPASLTTLERGDETRVLPDPAGGARASVAAAASSDGGSVLARASPIAAAGPDDGSVPARVSPAAAARADIGSATSGAALDPAGSAADEGDLAASGAATLVPLRRPVPLHASTRLAIALFAWLMLVATLFACGGVLDGRAGRAGSGTGGLAARIALLLGIPAAAALPSRLRRGLAPAPAGAPTERRPPPAAPLRFTLTRGWAFIAVGIGLLGAVASPPPALVTPRALALGLALLVGAAEEVFFRGYLDRALAALLPGAGPRDHVLRAGIGGALFGAYALTYAEAWLGRPVAAPLLWAVSIAAFTGFPLSLCHHRSGSLLVPLLAHALRNAALVLAARGP